MQENETYEKKKRFPRWIKVSVLSIILIAIFIAIAGTLTVYSFLQNLPSVQDAPSRVEAILKAHQGTAINLPLPSKIATAIVSVEDRRFYEHHGLDTLGFIKTILLDLHSSAPNGGATITEQLAKNLYITDDHTWKEKVEVAGLAVKLEQVYSKQQILLMYLNAIYYGDFNYGIQQASQGYYHTDPYSLSWAQASMLAGLPQAPSYYDPVHNLPVAKQRQLVVLDALVRAGYLTKDEETQIYNEPLTFYPAVKKK